MGAARFLIAFGVAGGVTLEQGPERLCRRQVSAVDGIDQIARSQAGQIGRRPTDDRRQLHVAAARVGLDVHAEPRMHGRAGGQQLALSLALVVDNALFQLGHVSLLLLQAVFILPGVLQVLKHSVGQLWQLFQPRRCMTLQAA